MIDERREAQASLYVLGALPVEEVRDFEQALRADLKLQLLVAELRSAADAMPLAFPQVAPPPTLKQSILRAVTPAEAAAVPVVVGPDSFTRALQNWLPWALAGCFAVLCILLLGLGHSFRQQATNFAEELEEKKQQYAELQRQHEELQNQVEQAASNLSKQVGDLRQQVVQKAEEAQKAQKQTAELQRQMEQKGAEVLQLQRQANLLQRQLRQGADEIQRLNDQLSSPVNQDRFSQLRVALLTPVGRGPATASGACVWDVVEQKGTLVIDKLTPLPSILDYQLWLIGDPKYAGPVSAAVFDVDAQGSVRLQFTTAVRVDAPKQVAVSVERNGGAATPSDNVVMIGQ
jgi:anti-sigma-K factor RskA